MNTKQIIARMDELLKPLGFALHKATWNRRSDCFVDVVALEASKSGDAVTISAGVLHPDIHRICWEAPLPAIIQEPDCIVRARIGHMIDDGKDLWWRLDDDDILNDISEKLNTHVLPFLERMHSLETMEQFLTDRNVLKRRYPPPVIYLAILKSVRGDKSGACLLLGELGDKTVGVWRIRIREIAGHLGCSGERGVRH